MRSNEASTLLDTLRDPKWALMSPIAYDDKPPRYFLKCGLRESGKRTEKVSRLVVEKMLKSGVLRRKYRSANWDVYELTPQTERPHLTS